MSTIYMNQLSTLPLMEMEGEQDQGLFRPAPFHVAKEPPILFPFMITNPVDQLQEQSNYGDQHFRQHVLYESTQQFTDQMTMSRSQVFPTRSSPFRQTIQSIDVDMIQRSAYDPYDIENNNKHTEGSRSDGWTVSSSPPAKMKIIRRKATSEYPEGGATRKPRRRPQAHQDAESGQLLQQQQTMGVVRVCSDCNTTKTPLWRSGPCGPKSLCNACGIRQRKARRAMVATAAAAAGKGGAPQAATQQQKPAKKEKRSDVDRSLPFKKRCKTMVVIDHTAAAATEATATPETADPTKDQPDHHVSSDKQVNGHAATSLQSKIATTPPQAISFHAFPADEITDAAMLLMTLSCGLARPQLAMASSYS